MALTTCEDCGKNISTLASACIHCGRPANIPSARTIAEKVAEGDRLSCSDGTCTGILNEEGNCRTCGKNCAFVDEDDGYLIPYETGPIKTTLSNWRVEAEHGYLSGAMICPHCGVKGRVRTKSVTQKKGLSGGKATGALLTGGLSVLLTGLSRKEDMTQAHCGNCGSIWTF